jgi:hypothetical protein
MDAYSGSVVLVQHDHSILSIKRNAGMMLAINRADLIFAHSPRSDFANYVLEHTAPDVLDILTG